MRLRKGDRDTAKLVAEAGLLQDDFVVARRQIDVNGAAGARTGLPGLAARVDELQGHVRQGDIVLVADVAD